MTSANFAPSGAQTNPELLQSIVTASETYSIVASQDIVEIGRAHVLTTVTL